MALKTIKVSPEIHKLVDEHTQKVGGKIGKFFEIAAREKLKNTGWPPHIEIKCDDILASVRRSQP